MRATYLCTLQVHVVIANLEVNTEQVHERYIVTGSGEPISIHELRVRENDAHIHINICGGTRHHELYSNAEQTAGLW